MKVSQRFSLIIFDWDGTLMDSTAHIGHCLLDAINTLSLEPRTALQVNDIIGLSLDSAISTLYPKLKKSLHQQLSLLFREKIMTDKVATPLFTGAENLLAQLQSADLDLAVATGNSRAGLDKAMSESGVAKYFPITRCADETFSKPHPQMLEEIITDYNIGVSEALMVGDSEYDLQMANNIGMPALAVSYGVHGRERLLAQQPLAIVDNLNAVGAFILD
ncbi:MAG: HAD-IA family hydrolase [Thiotrichaceae bacterium]|nr:HAD-IA family hydrolase [Thiotrichaceae bacterium]